MDREMLLEIRVKCEDALKVTGHTRDIVMIPFSGEAEGPLFRGTIAPFAVDTQKVPKGGKPFLSARYLLCGKDRDGNGCRVFIENQGVFGEEFTPLVVTDSPLLADWETAPLSATVEGAPGGVTVRLFRGA